MTIVKSIVLAGVLVFPLTAHGATPVEKCRNHFLHGQYDLAVQPCTKAAEQGDLNAQHWLGLIFSKGKGIPQDYGQAVKWRRLAAEQGDAVGQFNLGRMYEQGLGVQQDYKAAFGWYEKAVAQGNADAQYSMGSLYRKGKGVEQDTILAYTWYSLAVDQGLLLAVEPKEKLESELTPAQLKSAQQAVEKFKSDQK